MCVIVVCGIHVSVCMSGVHEHACMCMYMIVVCGVHVCVCMCVSVVCVNMHVCAGVLV